MDRISGVSEITFPESVVALGFGVSRFIHMPVFKTDPIPHPFTTKRNSAISKKKKIGKLAKRYTPNIICHLFFLNKPEPFHSAC